ncbi:hypothetical protein M0813_06371 [Anaeramoeba flamelloides]|uniref:Uncharacterized protein n=1 Tax=Anaeramoeba flamelloides TaxID=1746091 RepID=A0ABQ8XDT0_9EUKA|nr:hypothetical protein M0813_06371 [Anaeramoeba flamelloides]
MFIDNLDFTWRLKDQTIFLISLFPGKTSINNILRRLPLLEDLEKLKKGIFLGGKKIQALVSCFVGDTRESLPARGRLQPGGLFACPMCKFKLGCDDFTNPTVKKEPRSKLETIKTQKDLIRDFSNIDNNIYRYRKIHQKEKKTGVKLQFENIWIHELKLDPTSTSNFPICWFHLLLEGLMKNIFVSLCSKMDTNSKYLANERFKKIRLPKNIKRLHKPFGTSHLSSIDVQILIQFCSICIIDLVQEMDKNYIKFFYISSFLLSNIYQPTRNTEINYQLHQLILYFIQFYKLCSKKNCNRIMNLHLFAHHFEESIKKTVA